MKHAAPSLFLMLFFIFASSATYGKPSSLPYPSEVNPVKNLIILIPDGCGTSHMTIARWVKGAPLVQDSLCAGLVRTYSANSVVTGSAAAATAFATGYKTWEDDTRARCIAIRPDSTVLPTAGKLPADQAWRPVATILESARLSGRSTGLVVCSNINHATPAAFSAHWHDRDQRNVITKQQIYQNLDVALGGGLGHLLPTASGGYRNDDENLVAILQQRGYMVISTQAELQQLDASVKKVWGAFAADPMHMNLDRPFIGKTEPSLAQCARKAIDVLSQNEKGFFLMIEGSHVDAASHGNDPIGVAGEYIAFDSAVAVAVDFARKNGSTEVLIFPDHDNGGMSLGLRDGNYTSTPPDNFINRFKACRMTCTGLLDSLIRYAAVNGPIDWAVVAAHIVSLMGIDTIYIDDTMQTIPESANNASMTYNDIAKIGAIVNKRCNVTFATNGHTPNDVPMYSLLLRSSRTFDNTEIAGYCARVLEVDMQKTGDSLLAPAEEVFGGGQFTMTLDTAGCIEGMGSLSVGWEGAVAVFPFNKDYVVTGTNSTPLPGITVYSLLRNSVYLPRSAKQIAVQAAQNHAIRYAAAIPSVAGSEPFTVSVYDLSGRTVASKKYRYPLPGANRHINDTRHLPPGCYTVSVRSGGKESVRRIAVAK